MPFSLIGLRSYCLLYPQKFSKFVLLVQSKQICWVQTHGSATSTVTPEMNWKSSESSA